MPQKNKLSTDTLRREQHLIIYQDRSELALSDGTTLVFAEGPMSAAAKKRYSLIKQTLQEGWLNAQISLCRQQPDCVGPDELTEAHRNQLDGVVELLTSQNGRGLVVLMLIQLCIKSIEPAQSIRLHKGGRGGNDFSWCAGISMRTLDSAFITPALREQGLLNLNNDGGFMTRSLAENYPYSQFYKAAIRGARVQWLATVEDLETGNLAPLPALRHLLAQLLNRAERFEILATQTLDLLAKLRKSNQLVERKQVELLMLRHMSDSGYAARLMEISMHALMQALQEADTLGDASLVSLSQMRNANKKHGNIGDVELSEGQIIVESWDAKYGKSYLRDELEELDDKLALHPNVKIAGFVSSVFPDLNREIIDRSLEIEEIHGTKIEILSLEQWTQKQFERAIEQNPEIDEKQIGVAWMLAYTESLAQRRVEIAPIDEPCHAWLESLHKLLLDISSDSTK